ncbi:uncharacterized conserved protein YutE, UPF0331/DUF86 family [Thermodesulfovibrio aggregans]|uniref:Uncharacterized conserved protein YutE, UPF0331/DUF86 family n=1 Tax=Thermodesulfovibrio aggregans TaxID=86166 RepID=A0A0U9HRC3_9BACT|nr:DUF86 domain-containing protein [Thermodesulfovibrio aggregans]GAQ94282.1 uncharacterized conserved protein YutE, UPF0331/DUF86 family [Thermodesulfovibrio aggregans]
MLNKQFIKERLVLIKSYTEELKNLSKLDKETFTKNKVYSAAAESFLRRALEAIFDIGRHILAKKGYIDISKEYKSIASGLSKIGAVDDELSAKLIQMAGYRNRLVHMYHTVTEDELYEIITEDLKDIDKFIKSIKKLLQYD